MEYSPIKKEFRPLISLTKSNKNNSMPTTGGKKQSQRTKGNVKVRIVDIEDNKVYQII